MTPRFAKQPATLRLLAAAATLCAAGLAPTAAQAQETFKLGIVSFLSGQAAESFGIPAVNGAKILVDAFNKGAAPAPYNQVGFGGMKIEAVYIDENGGAPKQVQELRNLYDREKVDAVVGYVGSGDCLAVAPVAEEMKRFLILYDCGTPRIFEDGKYNYVFESAYEVVLKNAKKEPVVVTVQEPMPGDWQVLSSSQPHTKGSSNTAVWKISVPAEGSSKLVYRSLVKY